MPLSLPTLPSVSSISLPNVGGLLGGALGGLGALAAGSNPTPASQKASAAPMTFRLHDQTTPGASPTDLTLYVRPEEFSRNYSSRMAQHHTEGGSFIDSFGPGTILISMSGTVGWRRAAGSGIDGASADGFERFLSLFNQVFAGWHTARAEAVKKGKDPSLVKLILADNLHHVANVVAPQTFSLRRSKSRPLLLAYQLQLIVVEKSLEKVQAASSKSSSSGGLLAGIASLTGSIKAIGDMAKNLQSAITGTLLNPLRGFVSLTTGLYNQVASTAASIVGIPASLATAAHLTAQAGANIFRSLAVVEGLPAAVRGQLMQIGAEYTNVQCVLSNSLKQQATYTDYTPLYGASNCSSTNGGDGPSPLADQNPFFAVVPPASAASGVSSITIDAQAALRALAKADVVASPVPTVALTGLVTSINAGLKA